MNIQDALKILALEGDITPEIVEKAYRRAAMKYHPDRNPAGLEMMKAVNEAYRVLKDYKGQGATQDQAQYGEDMNAAINAVIECEGLKIEVCGSWVWLSGNTFPHKDTIKAAGFKWASAKKMWYFRPDEWVRKGKKTFEMEEIRAKYGSEEIATNPNSRAKLAK